MSDYPSTVSDISEKTHSVSSTDESREVSICFLNAEGTLNKESWDLIPPPGGWTSHSIAQAPRIFGLMTQEEAEIPGGAYSALFLPDSLWVLHHNVVGSDATDMLSEITKAPMRQLSYDPSCAWSFVTQVTQAEVSSSADETESDAHKAEDLQDKGEDAESADEVSIETPTSVCRDDCKAPETDIAKLDVIAKDDLATEDATTDTAKPIDATTDAVQAEEDASEDANRGAAKPVGVKMDLPQAPDEATEDASTDVAKPVDEKTDVAEFDDESTNEAKTDGASAVDTTASDASMEDAKTEAA